MPESAFWQSINPLWGTEEANQNGPTLYSLPAAQLISIKGPDAEKFMQGQFTCDLRSITGAQSTLGACCNLKGRMLVQFRILKLADNDFLLRCPVEVAEDFVTHLNKYKVFFKCELKLLDTMGSFGACGDEIVLQKILGATPQEINQALFPEEGLTVIRVAGEQPRFEIWVAQSRASEWLPAALQHCRQGSNNEWELLEIRAGIGEVYQPTREEFIPQMLNLQSLGGVSFKKGCYTGQEIVARMQYLGKLKKRMYQISIDAANALPTCEPGDKIIDADGRELGNIVRSAINTSDQHLALAILDNACVESSERIFLEKSPLAECHVHDLPYQVEATGESRPGR